MNEQKKPRLTVEVSEELRLKARIKSAKTGKPIAQVLREALERWVEENEEDTKHELQRAMVTP